MRLPGKQTDGSERRIFLLFDARKLALILAAGPGRREL